MQLAAMEQECPCRVSEDSCVWCEEHGARSPMDTRCHENCINCHGTGSVARIPKLRRECFCICHGTKGLLSAATQKRFSQKCTEGCYGCRGRGWLLIPEPEWTGVLMDILLDTGEDLIIWTGKDEIFVQVYDAPPEKGLTLNDALAACLKSLEAQNA